MLLERELVEQGALIDAPLAQTGSCPSNGPRGRRFAAYIKAQFNELAPSPVRAQSMAR